MATTLYYDLTKTDSTDTATTPTTTSKDKSSLGKDEFLHLLTTQLQYQDPLNPMDNTQFIGQMAQFSALEQMQNLNTSFATTKAVNLIGKTIVGTDADGKDVTGIVDSAKISSGKAYAVVGNIDVPLDNITEVHDVTEAETVNPLDLSKYTGLMNKDVEALVQGVNTDEVYSLQGNVYSIGNVQNHAIVTLNNVKAKIASLVISDEEKAKVTTVKDYLNNNLNKDITAIIKDATGNTAKITGKVTSVSGDDTNPDVVFDGVLTTVDSIVQVQGSTAQ